MNRRSFLEIAGIASLGRAFPKTAHSGGWRTFEVTTRIEVLHCWGATSVWVPAALTCDAPFQRTISNRFSADGGAVRMVESKRDGLGIVTAEFAAGVKPVVTVTSRVATKNYAVDLSVPGKVRSANRAELEYFRRSTKMLPTDGIVKATASEITRSAKTDLQKARAIYDWIVENTFRDPKVRGCGIGNIRFMLESKDLGGKCADLNALYVGLARAAGLAARDVYGIRIAKSELGYKSLGPATENISKAQHCRAEVYLDDYGWVPVDPADVRKVILEEPPGNRLLDDRMVREARGRLFGGWEMNWMAYSFAHDVPLPGSSGAPVSFLMYPQAETGAGRSDCLDPGNFKYEITAREIPNASEPV